MVGRSPGKPRVAGFIPGQGTYLGCGFPPWLGYILEAASFSLPLFFLLIAENKSFLKKSMYRESLAPEVKDGAKSHLLVS